MQPIKVNIHLKTGGEPLQLIVTDLSIFETDRQFITIDLPRKILINKAHITFIEILNNNDQVEVED